PEQQANAEHAWRPAMSRNPQSGWIGLPDRLGQARRDDGPPGVFAGPARAVDISRGCRSVGDTGTVRRSPGLPLLPHGIVKDVPLVGSWKINQLGTSSLELLVLPPELSVPPAGSLAHLRQCLIDGEARRLLARRELLERLHERDHDCLRRQYLG